MGWGRGLAGRQRPALSAEARSFGGARFYPVRVLSHMRRIFAFSYAYFQRFARQFAQRFEEQGKHYRVADGLHDVKHRSAGVIDRESRSEVVPESAEKSHVRQGSEHPEPYRHDDGDDSRDQPRGADEF